MSAGIQVGNTKLGHMIHAWSIPAVDTCPGASGVCKKMCYAMRGHFRQTNVKDAHARNWQFAQTAEFSNWMIGELRRQSVRTLRVHVAGDFADQPYLLKWLEIVDRCRDVRFFGYTRSWRIPELLPDLLNLGRLPNVSLWFSQDRETGPAPAVQGIRRAYMAVNEIDAATAPDDCDLVFRERSLHVQKRANGVLVCPAENGVQHPTGFHHTCSTCQLCFKDRPAVGHQRLQQLLTSLVVNLTTPSPEKSRRRAGLRN